MSTSASFPVNVAAAMIASVLVVVPYTSSRADSTATQNMAVSGAIVAPLQLAVTGLTMPHLVRPSGGEPLAQVTLACDATSDAANVVSYTNRSNPFAQGVSTGSTQSPNALSRNISVSGASSGACAVVTVSGEATFYYSAVIGAVSGALPSGVQFTQVTCLEASVGSFTSSAAQTIRLSAGGQSTIRCGGVTKVDSSSAATSYSASFPFTVTYD